jgi:hypothetical protein
MATGTMHSWVPEPVMHKYELNMMMINGLIMRRKPPIIV